MLTKKCKYCKTTKNLVTYHRVRLGVSLDIVMNVCEKHYNKYQKDKQLKRNKTNIHRYGVSNPMHNNESKQKLQKTNIERYGHTNPMKNEKIKNKAIETNKQRYGAASPLGNKKIKAKALSTLQKNYGVQSPMHNDEIKAKLEKTVQLKYGTNCVFKNKEIQHKLWSTRRDIGWHKFKTLLSLKKIEPLYNKEDHINADNTQYSYRCLRCNNIFTFHREVAQKIYCGCLTNRSTYEDEIGEWLHSLKDVVFIKNKKFYNEQYKYEVDLYLPEYNIGIDFHGNYWHSELHKESMYHQNKYLFFKEKNIDIIQVFEHRWLNKSDIIKSIVLNRLKKLNRIYARTCTLQEISQKETDIFLNAHHIQETINSTIRIGLKFNSELVAVGTFGKDRFNKTGNYELIRFCIKQNLAIIGGFSKILKYFEDTYKPTQLISYVDLTLFDGSGYKHNGFTQVMMTKPNYGYIHKDKTKEFYSRHQFQKHKLSKILKIFDSTLTEHENMLNNGYIRIFDAGNLKMIKTYKTHP